MQNDIAAAHPMRDGLDISLNANRRWLAPSPKPHLNAVLHLDIRLFDTTIAALQKATALPDPAPDLDSAAQRLLAALQVLGPVVKSLVRYESTRDYADDNLAYARGQHPVFVADMTVAIAAAAGLEAALSDHAIEAEQRQVAALPEGSLARRLVASGLDLHQVKSQLRALRAGSDTARSDTACSNTARLASALSALSASNQALGAALDALPPPPSPYCAACSRPADGLLGYGRVRARDARAWTDPTRNGDPFRTHFTQTVDFLGKCQAEVSQARP